MTRKKKLQLVVILPSAVGMLVIGGLLTFILTAGAGNAGNVTAAAQSNVTPASGESEGEGSSPGFVGGSAPSDGSEDEASQVVDPSVPVMPPPAACDFASWSGKPVDEAAVKATGRPYRILKPDSAVTEDYSPDRINVVTDDKGVVTEVHCG